MTSHYNVEKDQKANDWALGDTLGNMAANKTLYIHIPESHAGETRIWLIVMVVWTLIHFILLTKANQPCDVTC